MDHAYTMTASTPDSLGLHGKTMVVTTVSAKYTNRIGCSVPLRLCSLLSLTGLLCAKALISASIERLCPSARAIFVRELGKVSLTP
jgi:hypothetical protein